MKTIRQSITFDAAPREIYETLLDSRRVSRLTGTKNTISRRVGGGFSMFDGEVEGKNLELEPAKKIVQSWRHCQECWPEGHYSKVTISLKKVDGKTRLSFTHSGVPDKCYETLKKGWHDWYWKLIKEMLERKRAG